MEAEAPQVEAGPVTFDTEARMQRADRLAARSRCRTSGGSDMTQRTQWPWPQNLLNRMAPQPNGCIYFTGGLNPDGYGQAKDAEGRNRGAHRLAWEFYVGPIAPGLILDHLCHNADPSCHGGRDCLHRRCVNVEHLAETTNRGNVLAGKGLCAVNARKTHCKNGHEYTPENTRMRPDGARECRTCRRDIWL